MERVLGNKVKFSDLVIYSLSILMSCQFTNEPNREISRDVFQNCGVCGQVFPLLPSPSPFHFFCSRSNFRAITRLETLATQARKKFLMSIGYLNFSVIWIPKKNFICPSGKLRIGITSPVAKSTSPGLSDTTFFACWSFKMVISFVCLFPMHPLLSIMAVLHQVNYWQQRAYSFNLWNAYSHVTPDFCYFWIFQSNTE